MVYQGLTGVELRACPLLTHSTVLIRRRESPTACAVWPRHIRHECRTYMCKMVVRPWPLDRIATRLLATVGASCEFRSLQCGAVSRPPSRGGHPLSQTEQSLQHRTIIDAPCRSAQPRLVLRRECESKHLRAVLRCAVSALAATGEKRRSCASQAPQRRPPEMRRQLGAFERYRFV